MSWMCWATNSTATKKRVSSTRTIIFIPRIWTAKKTTNFTCIVSASRNDNVGVLFGLQSKEKTQDVHQVDWQVLLTGRQNSSKAGFTRFVYWNRTFSKSRPRSSISRSTENPMQLDFMATYTKISYLAGPNECQRRYQQRASCQRGLWPLCSRILECPLKEPRRKVGWWRIHHRYVHWSWNRTQELVWIFPTECPWGIWALEGDQMHLEEQNLGQE